MSSATSTDNQPVGLLETPFFSVTAVITDHLCKMASVEVLSLEPTGSETILIRMKGQSVADVDAGLAHARAIADQMGVKIRATSIARPLADLITPQATPGATNPLYGGREAMFPSPRTAADFMNKAIGILETQGLAAALGAADAMLKTAAIEIVGKEKIGAAYVTIVVRGDVAAVEAALRAGSTAVEPLGKLIAWHVIARPHEGLLALLPG